MKTLATLSILIAALVFTGCNETKKAIDVAGNIQLTGNYTVTALNGRKLNVATNPTFTLSALNNSLRGTTGCNSVFGDYTLDLSALDFGDLAVSEKYCEDKEIMTTERDFLDALKQTGSYSLENNVLTFYSKTDRSPLLKAQKETNKP